MGGGQGGFVEYTYEMEAMKLYRMYQLGQLIRRTISPGTWNQIVIPQMMGGAGGVGGAGAGVGGQVGGVGGAVGAAAGAEEDPTKGIIEFSPQGKYMVVYHTLEVQKQVETLLNQMRIALGEQVSIEARFLIVGENFLEDLGVDVDITYDPGVKGQNVITFNQTNYSAEKNAFATSPTPTKVPGTLAGTASGAGVAGIITGGFGNALVDDLQVDFIIRAAQSHKDSKILTAPKVTVLSGETAAMSVTTINYIAMLPMTQQTTLGFTGGTNTQQNNIPQSYPILTGPQLTVTPIITQDKKHVLLNITAVVQDFLGMNDLQVKTTTIDTAGVAHPVTYASSMPETETSTVQTRVSVPDGGTLLLGGLKITAEEEVEAGIPILSKIPILGRAFDSRSKIKDSRILLILVKPTIILQTEKDIEAISAMELPSSE